MGRITTIIFDLDGTLVDSAPDLLTAANHILSQEGRRALDLADIKMMVGDGVPRLVELAFEATGEPAGERLEELAGRFVDFYHDHAADDTRPYAGVVAALDALRAAGLRLGICTNKPHSPTMEILETLNLASYFDAVIGGDSLPGIKKPDPRHIQAGLNALDATPESALMVGDSRNDVLSAQAAGLPAIAYAHGYAKMDPAKLGADLILDDFADLPEIIADWS